MPRNTVLIVDDEPNVLASIRRNLVGLYDVVVATSGDAALELIERSGPFAAIVSDMQMGAVSGIDFLRRARELSPHSPRVMLTGHADMDVMSAAINEAGVFMFLRKPAGRDELLTCLEACEDAYRQACRLEYPQASSECEAARAGSALARADMDREFTVNFQPRVDARDHTVVSAEALLRWVSPDLGPVSPAVLIPIAESAGHMPRITKWLLHTVCRLWRDRIQPLNQAVSVSVNVSPSMLTSEGLVATVLDALKASGLPADRLEIEITEEVQINDRASARTVISKLQALGIAVSIDDFGSGFASIAYLTDLDIDCVKVDRAIVIAGLEQDRAKLVLESLRALTRRLDIKLVAEGIEDQRFVDLTSDIGFDELQGYHFSKPLEIDAFESWLLTRTTGSAAVAAA